MNSIYEIDRKILTEGDLPMLLKKKCNLILKGRTKDVLIGKDVAIKVNANIGISQPKDEKNELKKLDIIANSTSKPDTMMDHTIINIPLWKKMVEYFDGPVGALPHYSTFKTKTGIDDSEFLEKMEEMISGGISFFTIHPTANFDLLAIAKKERRLPTTSRGGAIVLRDMIINGHKKNIFERNMGKILSLAKKNNITLSIGSIFRPSCNSQALDAAHVEETKLQKHFIDMASNLNIKVMMEGLGHITLSDIDIYINLKKDYDVPFMPLGPIATDIAFGADHIASAIGAAYMCHNGGAQIINSITPEEHTGGIPSPSSILTGIATSRIVSEAVNICKFPILKKLESGILHRKAMEEHLCIGDTTHPYGCSRCFFECPLTLIN